MLTHEQALALVLRRLAALGKELGKPALEQADEQTDEQADQLQALRQENFHEKPLEQKG